MSTPNPPELTEMRALTHTSAIPENLQILSHANSTPVGCIDSNEKLSVIKRHKLKNTRSAPEKYGKSTVGKQPNNSVEDLTRYSENYFEKNSIFLFPFH